MPDIEYDAKKLLKAFKKVHPSDFETKYLNAKPPCPVRNLPATAP
jgi:hypothetical protein